MDEEKEKSSVWIYLTYLAWVTLFIAACVVAFVAWKTMGNLKIDVFPLGTTIEGLGSQITRIEEHYSSLANEQKELLEIWGLAALILGISGAVASILRSPQAVIVAFGGFAALIFGATKIYDPQLSVKTLNSAISQLACVRPKVQTLTDLNEKIKPLIPSALSGLIESFQPLLEDSASFTVQVNRLGEIRSAQQEERNVAINAVEQALQQPTADLSYERLKLKNQQANIQSARDETEALNKSNPTEEISQLLSKITTIDLQLSDAIDTLTRPEMMEERLSSQARAYQEEMTRSASWFATGQKLSSEALALTQALPEKIDKLRVWPTDFENAVAVAHTVTNKIQNQAISKIASGGVAENPIQNIVIAATDALINKSVAPTESALSTGSADLVQQLTALSSALTLPEGDVQAITQKANKAINRAEQLLLDYRDKLEYADTRIRALDELIINQLPVIAGSVKMLRTAIKKLSEATPDLQLEVDAANQALKKANEILNRRAPSQLKVEIEACT